MIKVLIGPTYLEGIEGVAWHDASVRYLKKNRSVTTARSDHVHYDHGTMERVCAGNSVDAEFTAVLLGLNRDVNCLLLAERERNSVFSGAFLAPIDIARCAKYAWQILTDNRPDLLVFHNHPHELFTYVLLKVALRLNIVTLLVHFSALPWRMCISKYQPDASLLKLQLGDHPTEAALQAVRNYMNRLRATHEAAIPFGDLALISAKKRDLYFGDDFRSVLRGDFVKGLLRILRKWKSYREYKPFVSSLVQKPYVVFFLHYQPEESTLPRGGIFAQQLNAILKLRSLLPSDVSILVKENKATFRAPAVLAIGVRNAGFYKAITDLPGTFLVPLEFDTFELLDGSEAIATITGSVGLESLCRGKPVIVFGDANYKDFSGVIRAESDSVRTIDLRSAARQLHPELEATQRDLLSELQHSIGADTEDNKTNFRYQQIATVATFDFIAKNPDRFVISVT